jgi:drug/metabolite transporter (DMT)-like permease
MKAWQVAALLVVLVVGAVVVMRPRQAAAKTTQAPKTSNDTFSSLVAFGAAIGGKVLAPGASTSSPKQIDLGQQIETPSVGGSYYYDKSSGATDFIAKDTLPETY